MGIEDLTGKAQEFLKEPRVTEALKSEQAEDISDNILDGAANAVQKATGDKFTDQVQGARDAADKAVGNQ